MGLQKDKIEEWIKKEGIPLEYFTANSFLKSHYSVTQGKYVEDENLLREIDIDATKTWVIGDDYFRIHDIVECKWTKDKPWIVFNSHMRMNPSASIAQTFGNELGQALMWKMAGEEELQRLSLFNDEMSLGFGGRQAFSNTDNFYSAVQSIVTKTILSGNKYNNVPRRNPFEMISICFPIIVIDGQLYTCDYNAVDDSLQMTETKHCLLDWRGNKGWKFHTRVNIVTKDYLEKFLQLRNEEINILLKYVFQYIANLKECYSKKDISVLKIKNASTGMIGLPSFLANIFQKNP